MFYTGSGAQLQFGKESTFGTGVAPTNLVDLTSESIKQSVEKGDEGSLLASKTAMSRDLLGITLDGSISGILRPEMAGLMFHAALGGADTVAAATIEGNYTHTFNLCGASALLPSLTFVMDRHAAVKKYAGCTIGSLSLECAAGDYVKFSADLKGIKEEAGALTSGLTLSIPAYRCTNASFTIGGTSFDISNATWKLDNALEDADKTYASGLYLGQPQHGQREVSIDFDIPYNAGFETFKSTYLDTETNAAIVLTFQSTNSDYKVSITMPNVAITDADAGISGTGKISASASGVALTVGSTEPVTVVVEDKTSTAYGA